MGEGLLSGAGTVAVSIIGLAAYAMNAAIAHALTIKCH
jgi:hypothetical protein